MMFGPPGKILMEQKQRMMLYFVAKELAANGSQKLKRDHCPEKPEAAKYFPAAYPHFLFIYFRVSRKCRVSSERQTSSICWAQLNRILLKTEK
jgi:hypothetical protein